MNRTIEIPDNCQRIVSLVPSQTELLVDLGLEDKIVGITKFCIHPKGLKQSKTVIGGTKNFHLNKIRDLNPDLIIGNKEENYKEGIETLEREFPVWMSEIFTLKDAIKMISSVGTITNTSNKAEELVDKINHELDVLKQNQKKIKTALYFIWKNPYMVAGTNNYINSILDLNEFNNLANKDTTCRYPELNETEIKKLNPEVILLSSEPFPFQEKHIEEFKSIVPNSEIKIVDGELYSWYGSRLLTALKKFNQDGN